MIQQVLLDVHEAKKEVDGLKELGEVTVDDGNELKKKVVERAEGALQKLDKLHTYLMGAFDNKLEIVLHKAQVIFLNILFEDRLIFNQVQLYLESFLSYLKGGYRSLFLFTTSLFLARNWSKLRIGV